MCQLTILLFSSIFLLCYLSFVKGKDSVNCNFDKGPCQWKEEKKNCWLVSHQNETLAGTKGFLHFNSSCQSGEIKTKPLSSFFFKSDEELHFSYLMHGEGYGELSIVDHDFFGQKFGNKPHIAFHCKGNHGKQWYHGHVKIAGGTKLMGIVAKTRGSFTIAIDNITSDSHGSGVPAEQICPPYVEAVKLSTTTKPANKKPSIIPTTITKSPSKNDIATVPTRRTESPITGGGGAKNKMNKTKTSKIVTAMKTNHPLKVTTLPTLKDKQHGQTSTPTPPGTSRTTMRKIAEPKLRNNNIEDNNGINNNDNNNNDEVDNTHFHVSAKHLIGRDTLDLETPKDHVTRVTVIVGSCFGIAALVVAMVSAFFIHRRLRQRAMYSFNKTTFQNAEEKEDELSNNL